MSPGSTWTSGGVSDASVVLALAEDAADAGVLAVERDGAMAVVRARHPEALADRAARDRLLSVAKQAGIRDLAVELVDDDRTTPRLPRD